MAEREEFEVDENWVLYEVVERHIARITINRPERRNALLSPDMHELFEERLRRAERDDDVKVVLLVGAGPDFCAGDDVRRLPVERAGLKKGSKLPQTARHRERASAAPSPDELAGIPEDGDRRLSGCDGRRGPQPGVGGRSRHRRRRGDVRPPQARIGFAGFSTAMPLALLKLGVNRGYEAMITGRRISAEEMQQWGVVSSIVPEADLEAEAMRYARAIAHHSADGLMIGKQALITFWHAVGMAQFGDWVEMAHPVFTNLVWREDEYNFFKERGERGGKEALAELNRRYAEWGFE